jgi:hypothetical protein
MWKLIFLIAIVFVLMYDPKSRTLETLVGQPRPPTEKSCEDTHYQAVQFAQSPYECPTSGRTHMGVIT